MWSDAEPVRSPRGLSLGVVEPEADFSLAPWLGHVPFSFSDPFAARRRPENVGNQMSRSKLGVIAWTTLSLWLLVLGSLLVFVKLEKPAKRIERQVIARVEARYGIEMRV